MLLCLTVTVHIVLSIFLILNDLSEILCNLRAICRDVVILTFHSFQQYILYLVVFILLLINSFTYLLTYSRNESNKWQYSLPSGHHR